jgi:carbon-monoxide dehydrogenase medium subunit
MKPAAFEYVAPRSVKEAVALLVRYGEDAKVIAGGQSLVPMMAFRLATPSALIDLNGIAALEYVRRDGDILVLGALARHRAVQELAWLRGRCAVLAEGVDLIGHPAIRNRGTVGGSLAHADPAAEWPALLLALDGEVDAVGAGGRRTIPATELFETYFTTSLRPDEVIVEARVALPVEGALTGSSFVELARRHGDFAIAGTAVVMVLAADGSVANARISLIGVRDTAIRARAAEAILSGATPADEALAEAANAVQREIEPISDVHGSSEYRRRVATVVVRRALTMARDRAHARAG